MKKLLLGLLTFIGLCLLCIGLYIFLFNSKIGSHPISELGSLMVDTNDFPSGWKFSYSESINGRDAWGEDSLSKVFTLEPDKGYGQQYLYRFDNVFEAMYAYFFLSKELPVVKDKFEEYSPYKSNVANNWYFVCGRTDSGRIICDVLARYDDFISYFHINVESEYFSSDQLEKILRVIDERIGKHITK